MASSTTRPSLGSPQVSSTRVTPKKPSLGKRTLSAGPKRGQEFSVDDAQEEVQQDKASSSSSHVLNRKASTLRRRPTAQPPQLARVESDEREDSPSSRPQTADFNKQADSDDTEITLRPDDGDDANAGDDQDEESDNDDDEEDDADLSDAESFTLKDRQEAINETHPFGIRIWKPALYKKSRSVQVTYLVGGSHCSALLELWSALLCVSPPDVKNMATYYGNSLATSSTPSANMSCSNTTKRTWRKTPAKVAASPSTKDGRLVILRKVACSLVPPTSTVP